MQKQSLDKMQKNNLPIFYTCFVQTPESKKNPESIRYVEESLCGYYTHKMCAFEFCFWTDMFCLTVSFEIAC